MPATMMHLFAAYQLIPSHHDAFLLGSILPDCVDAHREIKDRLHFRDVPPEKRLESLILFGKKLTLSRPFDLGVLFHFYLDYLWDNGPQKAHRKMHGEENWFPDYRKELKMAGSRTAQRAPWSDEVWLRLRNPDKALYENSMGLPEDEIVSFLEHNCRWHREVALPESEIFTDALVDSFLNQACRAFTCFLADFFPETYRENLPSFAPSYLA